MDPIDRQIKELTRESPRAGDGLHELARPRGEMGVWWGDEDVPLQDEDDEDNE